MIGLNPTSFRSVTSLDDTPFQFLVYHSAAAVFDHDDLAVETLNIWQGLDKHLRLFKILLHIFIHPYLLRGRSKTRFDYVPNRTLRCPKPAFALSPFASFPFYISKYTDISCGNLH